MDNSKSKIKIVFFADTGPQGSSLEHRGRLMSRELQKYGIEYGFYAGLLGSETSPIPDLRSYFSVVARLRSCDILLLHRQGNLLAYLTLLMSKLMGKKAIYDFDDALFAHEASRNVTLHRIWYGCLPNIIKKCDMVTAGSHFLVEYASSLNENVHLIPTPVDTALFHPLNKVPSTQKEIIIGWMGQANFHVENLRILVEPLAELSKKYPIRLKLVSALGVEEVKHMFGEIGTLSVDYGLDRMVSLREVPELMSDFDISVAPITNDTFSKGKCAMKALESMAMGIPVVASAVGEHNYLIKEGVNGFLAATPDEWVKKLAALIEDEALRKRIGQNGLETVKEEGYSLQRCAEKVSPLYYGLLER